MKAKPAAAQRVSYEDLLWIAACLGFALAPQVATLPIWVLVIVCAAGGMRLLPAAHGRCAPPRSIRLLITLPAIALLFLEFRSFNGVRAGSALLSLMAGLKLLETQTRRDIHVITLIIYFLSLASLLQGDSFWLLAYLIALCWLTTAALLRLTSSTPAPAWQNSVRHAGRMLAQALPLALVLWLFFPRFAGPLWHLPDEARGAASGLSERMSPGDITELALSDEIAFRAHFAGATPPPSERYWRGPVLHDFDGRTWQGIDPKPAGAPAVAPRGPAYRYTLSLEASQHIWIFALDWPVRSNLAQGVLTEDQMLVRPLPLLQPLDVEATSYTQAQALEPSSRPMRRRDTRLPPNRNPRTLRLSQQLRSAHPQDADYVRAVLELFRRQAFFYTLTPPKLGTDSIDEFLFDTRRGFCGHYASAFAALMRAAGIPARVVTGYQGGTFNRFADYWILRQSDAHAWDEIWLEDGGWQRIDPTASVAPERVEHGLNDSLAADRSLISRWQQRGLWFADTRLRLDALGQLWRQRILRFDQGSQENLLKLMRIARPDGQKLTLVLAVGLTFALTWLTWRVRREAVPHRSDRLQRGYQRLCAKLAAAGMPRRPQEGAEAYAERISQLRPDIGPAVGALCRHYTALRYEGEPSRITLEKFNLAVRAFRAAP